LRRISLSTTHRGDVAFSKKFASKTEHRFEQLLWCIGEYGVSEAVMPVRAIILFDAADVFPSGRLEEMKRGSEIEFIKESPAVFVEFNLARSC
jgi:hypothetical protein